MLSLLVYCFIFKNLSSVYNVLNGGDVLLGLEGCIYKKNCCGFVSVYLYLEGDRGGCRSGVEGRAAPSLCRAPSLLSLPLLWCAHAFPHTPVHPSSGVLFCPGLDKAGPCHAHLWGREQLSPSRKHRRCPMGIYGRNSLSCAPTEVQCQPWSWWKQSAPSFLDI